MTQVVLDLWFLQSGSVDFAVTWLRAGYSWHTNTWPGGIMLILAWLTCLLACLINLYFIIGPQDFPTQLQVELWAVLGFQQNCFSRGKIFRGIVNRPCCRYSQVPRPDRCSTCWRAWSMNVCGKSWVCLIIMFCLCNSSVCSGGDAVRGPPQYAVPKGQFRFRSWQRAGHQCGIHGGLVCSCPTSMTDNFGICYAQ